MTKQLGNMSGTLQQQFRESTGVGGAADITELPEEYLQLERRWVTSAYGPIELAPR